MSPHLKYVWLTFDSQTVRATKAEREAAALARLKQSYRYAGTSPLLERTT
jgi:hypothetical protein